MPEVACSEVRDHSTHSHFIEKTMFCLLYIHVCNTPYYHTCRCCTFSVFHRFKVVVQSLNIRVLEGPMLVATHISNKSSESTLFAYVHKQGIEDTRSVRS